MGHLVTQFQGQILRAAANNGVRTCLGCGYAPTSPIDHKDLNKVVKTESFQIPSNNSD